MDGNTGTRASAGGGRESGCFAGKKRVIMQISLSFHAPGDFALTGKKSKRNLLMMIFAHGHPYRDASSHSHRIARHRMPPSVSRRENLIRCLVSGFCLSLSPRVYAKAIVTTSGGKGGGEGVQSAAADGVGCSQKTDVGESGIPAVFPSLSHVTDPCLVHYPTRPFVSTLSPVYSGRAIPDACWQQGESDCMDQTETVMTLRVRHFSSSLLIS